MTLEVSLHKADGIIESTLVKGGARLSMFLVAFVFFPFITFVGMRELSTVDRAVEAQVKMSEAFALLAQAQANDRSALSLRFDQVEKRIDLVFLRINMLATRTDVDKDLQLRDLRIETLDHRIGGVESRMNGPAAH